MSKNTTAVPRGLRQWFIVHFIVDIVVAVPLFFMAVPLLRAINWPQIDPFATRLVAAAFFGIGLESLLGRNGSREMFHGMLTLKIIWSAFAVAGISLTMLSDAIYRNVFAWTALFIFIFFLLLWGYWKARLLRVTD
jgi:hypothetical protein